MLSSENVNQLEDEEQNSHVPSSETKPTPELSAEPLCKDCRVGRGYRPFLDYVELCRRHAAVEALIEAATKALAFLIYMYGEGTEIDELRAALALAESQNHGGTTE